MENTEYCELQHMHYRFQRPRILPGHRTPVFVSTTTLIISLLLLIAMPYSCKKAAPATPPVEEVVPVPERDSVLRHLSLSYGFSEDSPLPEGRSRCLDLIVFEKDGSSLDRIVRFDGNPEEIDFYTYEGDKIYAAVANSPKKFNPAALGKTSILSQIKYNFIDDCPQAPIMGGKGSSEEDGIELKPMLCRIIVEKIHNGLENYELLEAPRVRLSNINATVAMFDPEEDYMPELFVDHGEWTELPYDIGMFAERLDVVLYCYPNMSELMSSWSRTMLELECEIEGTTRNFEFHLPKIGENSITACEIFINSKDDANCKFSRIEE